eukprot:Skav236374  [mRNA]  locus=scaffold4518:23445:26994:- [translate_table: standard]
MPTQTRCKYSSSCDVSGLLLAGGFLRGIYSEWRNAMLGHDCTPELLQSCLATDTVLQRRIFTSPGYNSTERTLAIATEEQVLLQKQNASAVFLSLTEVQPSQPAPVWVFYNLYVPSSVWRPLLKSSSHGSAGNIIDFGSLLLVRVAALAVLAVHVLADNDCDNADDPTSMLQNFQTGRTSPGKQAERGKSELCFCAILHVKLTFTSRMFVQLRQHASEHRKVAHLKHDLVCACSQQRA